MRIKIERSRNYHPNSIPGILFIDEVPRFVTLENKRKAIPPGVYHARRDTHYGEPGSENDYTVWELYDVPDRTQIQIHILNYWYESKGCVGIGSSFSANMGMVTPMITDSKLAHIRWMHITKDETELEIEII